MMVQLPKKHHFLLLCAFYKRQTNLSESSAFAKLRPLGYCRYACQVLAPNKYGVFNLNSWERFQKGISFLEN